jgi:hypothetical protein
MSIIRPQEFTHVLYRLLEYVKNAYTCLHNLNKYLIIVFKNRKLTTGSISILLIYINSKQ